MKFKLATIALSLMMASAVCAQSGKPLTGEQLAQLTQNGITLKLGGAGLGYSGSLKLSKNGKGKGSATTDAGDKVSIAGTWKIEDGKFCRIWKGLDEGQQVCETWYPASGNSVEVYNGKKRIGVNSW